MSRPQDPTPPKANQPQRVGDDVPESEDIAGLGLAAGKVAPGGTADPANFAVAPPDNDGEGPPLPTSRGFWGEAWHRFRRRYLAMGALGFVVFLALVAIFSPAIVGTKPVICQYKGGIYFPALYYYDDDWEPAIFRQEELVDTVIVAGSTVRYNGKDYEVDYVNRSKDLVEIVLPNNEIEAVSLRDVELVSGGQEQTIGFLRQYSTMLTRFDPDSWAIWPLVYQDPERPVRSGEWPDQPGNPGQEQGSPSRYNLFGTTPAGVDVFAIMVHGSRTALLIGFLSMGIASAIGVTVGANAGYFRGAVDSVLSRIIEVVLCIPTLVLILAMISVVSKPSIWHIMAIIGLTSWTSIARLTRAEFLKLRESDFVIAARGLGAGSGRIMFLHILRNATAPILVPITFGIASAILIESGLSFLGFGPPPPAPSWGALLALGRDHYNMWWLILFPGIAIFLTVLAYNLIGEGLQEATDPRLRETGR